MTRNEASPEVYGVETEYSHMLRLPGNKVYELVGECHSTDAKIGLYEAPRQNSVNVIPKLDDNIGKILEGMNIRHGKGGMLSNGGRLYIDPSGIEYATPETATAEDAVLRSFEGDLIVSSLLNKLRESGTIKGFQINRRIVDHNRSSRGIHLNTLTSLREMPEPQGYNDNMYRRIAALNVAKGALFGSGGLLLNEYGETEYHHSPRLSLTDNLQASWSEYTKRPLVRTNFKTDFGTLSRVETVTSDALNFGWPMKASLVATNAVIGLIELRKDSKLPKLDKRMATDSARDVGFYGYEGMVHIKDHGKSRPEASLDVIRRISEIVLQTDDSLMYLSNESRRTMEEIIEVADKMDDDPYSVIDQVESMARLVSMERKMEQKYAAIDSETMCKFDYAWDLIGGGIAENLRDKGLAGWKGFGKRPSISQTKKRLSTPPQNTRAKIRGDLISAGVQDQSTSWHTIQTKSEESRDVHPLDTDLSASISSTPLKEKIITD